MASGSDRNLRPRLNRNPQPTDGFPPGYLVASDPPSLPPLRSLGARARAPFASSPSSISRSGRSRAADADRHLRSRVRPAATGITGHIVQNLTNTYPPRSIAGLVPPDLAMPRPSSGLSQPLRDHDVGDEGRPYKRRKVIQDRVAPGFKGFRYGRYGQVEPGQLTMEIMSCDGGLYDEHTYPPENILKNDNSVYCTKSNRCNIVLKHQGGTLFSLQELIIKAPGSRFSCPIREGMVFVAMDSDELLTRTAQYQIQYLPCRPPRRGTVIFRHEDDGTRVARLEPSRPLRASFSWAPHDDYEDDDDDDDDDDDNDNDNNNDDDNDDDDDDDDDDEDADHDNRTAHIPPEFTAHPLPYNITTVCSEDESDDPDHAAHPEERPRRPPPRIGTLPFESDSDESIQISFAGRVYRHWPDPADVGIPSVTVSSRRPIRPYSFRVGNAGPTSTGTGTGTSTSTSNPHRLNVPPVTSDMTLEEARDASQIATQEAVRAVGGELMAPLAHFFIEKNKNKCTIRFDPPVTGRYLLLKMWSPHQDPQNNIDIQAVIAKGFAGPRYCPSVELA
ncbi:hypothetical protein VTJ83DRAFT_2507 [Remersonia thermophila]|uniref:Uncharacterized protein n=1 Tax=Remersonia thermophila TaxID=72144 RepID=A0ABR4DIX6_9PEZI